MAEQPSTIARFFGAALMAVGILIALLSGACTGVFLFLRLQSGSDLREILYNLGIGLPFIVLGILLFVVGRALSRGREL